MIELASDNNISLAATVQNFVNMCVQKLMQARDRSTMHERGGADRRPRMNSWSHARGGEMATRRALHFVFKVADRTATAAFYRETLGMKVSSINGVSMKICLMYNTNFPLNPDTPP